MMAAVGVRTALRSARRPTRLPGGARARGRRLARFAVVGAGATGLQVVLFALLHVLVPLFWANLIAWGASTVVGNQVNRSLTFGRHGRPGASRDFAVSSAFSLVGLAVTTLVLLPVDDQPTIALVVLVAVNAVVGLGRFLGLRRWFAGHDPADPVV
ncbi:GtrA family protein [Nakamurella deserti]|uniref:GtrA family protein n=1 Tax=Nakamurella deserti TaxID=2164074 RepID=UPI000DBE7A9F|nr:GtrA family protein [Nakamurella deserti]